MCETKNVSRRAESRTVCKPLQIVIPCGDHELVPAALRAATGLARDLNATVTLVSVNVVPFPLPLDRPDVNTDHLLRRLKELSDRCPIPVRILMLVARDHKAAIRGVVPAGSLVVLATRNRWWRTAEVALAGALRRDGHRVVLLTANAERPVSGGDGQRAVPVVPLDAAREVGSNRA